jgi:hypothetical protein
VQLQQLFLLLGVTQRILFLQLQGEKFYYFPVDYTDHTGLLKLSNVKSRIAFIYVPFLRVYVR